MNLNKVFSPKGLLSQHFKDYEQRPEQVRMAKMVQNAIANGYSAVIEGGTGIGKSLAYLVPLILSGKKAIISTSNKNLQDQLDQKDLPMLKKILPMEFDWTVLKGRNNYFCPESFNIHSRELSSLQREEKTRAIEEWAYSSHHGDIEQFPGELQLQIKALITCNRNRPHSKKSPYYGLCFANQARAKAKTAQIVLINHSLLAFNLVLKKETDNKVSFLPETDVIIIDEAHTLVSYMEMALSSDVSIFTLRHFLSWAEVKKVVKKGQQEHLLRMFNDNLLRFIPEKKKSYYSQKKFDSFDGFDESIDKIDGIISKVRKISEFNLDELEQRRIQEIAKEGDNLIERLVDFGKEDEEKLRWSEAREFIPNVISVKLKSIPLNVSGFLKENLFDKNITICTSATLAVGKDLSFFKFQLGVPETALNLVVDSPFDYGKNALVYVSNGEQDKLWEMDQLIRFSKGNAFILFTAYKEMYELYESLDVPYPKLIQSRGVSRSNLLKQFKETPNAVLFATKSFWEGIDVKGNSLVLVIIHKIPFENPSDLIFKTKTERIDEKYGKGKHWIKYTIPDACLKLKQGTGRLIRSKTDFGVIALLDSRVNFRNYGKAVVDILPPAPRTQRLEDVKRFFESKGI